MPLLDGFPGVSGATDFGELRKLFAGLVARNALGAPRPGILRDATGPLITGRGDLKVDVARFPFISVRDNGAIFGLNEGTTQVALPALPTSNKRIDILWVRQNISDLGDPSDLPQFGWSSGDAAAIPQPPTTPLPAGAFEVGRLQVSVGTTATNDATKVTITQASWNNTGLAGTSIPFPTLGDLKAWNTAARGQLARIESLDGDWRWNGTVWVPQFAMTAKYSYRANVPSGGTETSFAGITPAVDGATSHPAIGEALESVASGWRAKFDLNLTLHSNSFSAIGAARQSLNNRGFWRSKRNGGSYEVHSLYNPFEFDGVDINFGIRLKAGETLSFNAYQTLGTTSTLVLDPLITYLGPA